MRSRTETVYLLTFLLLVSTFAGIYTPGNHVDELDESQININSISRNTNLIDVPSWKIGDKWNYNGYLDMVDFIIASGVNTNLQELTGTLESTVTDIYLTTVDNTTSLVYKVESDGYYEANSINLDGQPGDLEVTMETTSVIRASDLATVSQDATIDINFCRDFLWWCVDVSVGTLEVNQAYSPPLEGYDFPLSVGESWSQDYTTTTTYDGQSDYVDIPDDTISQSSSIYEIVSQGYSGVNYGSCATSYNISSTNGDGDDTGYKWFCPGIEGDIKMETIESLGFTAVHSLSSYQSPTQQKIITVDVEFPLSPINIEASAWINVTNNGNPVGNQIVQFRYEIEENVQNVTTSSNGSAHIIFNTGDSADYSNSEGLCNNCEDLGSHGILAWIGAMPNRIVGATTVTIDPDVYEIDLYTNQDGVSVERTRLNTTITLDNNVGFTAIRDDLITFSIPVINRGLRSSTPSTLEITEPDGTVTYANIPSLSSLEEARVEVSWTVPSNQPFGNIDMQFNIDIEDGDLTNNQGEFNLFIGSIPIALLMIVEESLTLNEVSFNGLNSYDPDGGGFYCTFSLESLSGEIVTSEESDCIFEYTWDDDGIFTINMVVTDEESDFHSVSNDITILNRAPEITISVESDSSPVLSPITFEITERIDLDTQTPDAPIDIIWNAPCDQGVLGIKCTVTPTEEGPYTIEVDAVDDDGEQITESYSIDVTNIAPYDPEWEVIFDGNRIIPNSYGLYTVDEGDQLTIRGWAEDSENDKSSLQHVWVPDAEDEPDIKYTQEGLVSSIQHTYNTEGQHIATFQVFDDNNEGTDLITVPFKVNNLPPTIRPFSQPLPVAEDTDIELSIVVDDTLYDVQSLIPCYDLDPYTNSDNYGTIDDDCDLASYHLVHSWPDSNTAPDKIIFHVTDNDGETASIEIPLDIRNMKPNVGYSVSESQPMEGDTIILSGNGTIDSDFDMQNMVYSWDMDISKDSDGDGDNGNDRDIIGKTISWTYNSAGSKVVQLTVDDGDSTDSVRMTIQVQEIPFELSAFIFTPIGIIIILLILILTIGMGLILKKKEVIVEISQRNNLSMDDAFDDPDYDPFSEEKQKQKISKKRIKKQKNKPATKKPDNIDKDLLIDDTDDKINQEMDELRAKLKELEDKNLSANEVMSTSEIEELIGEEE
ncbi:MAG: hypothetical protein NLN66_00235 [Candidatus Thalassarchaeaceae archaeon]|nr:hypothetical protein [Candidatus Thalassarchaeaceae archaeon]